MNDTSRKWGLVIGAVFLAIGITACSGKKAETPSPSASPSETVPASPSVPADTVKQGFGEYVGLADGHTVEIITNGTPVSYQFDSALLLETMDNFQTGDRVTFEYEVKDIGNGNTQNWLTKIEKADPAGEGSQAGEGQKAASGLPATKDITLQLEGNEEVRTAKLAEGNGFALYVFDIFSFDPQRGVLSMNVDSNYNVSIEKLPAGYSLENIKKAASEDLAKVGDVRELDKSEISPALGGTALYMTGKNNNLIQEIIVKEIDGIGYKIRVNKPVGEPLEGFNPHVYASLGTLTNL